jgi:hypothetical protein
MTPNDVRLISSMLAIIAKLHVRLLVDDHLNVWSIYGILSSMVENKHQFCPKNTLMHGRGWLSNIAKRRFHVEPRMLVRSPHFGVRVFRKILLKM